LLFDRRSEKPCNGHRPLVGIIVDKGVIVGNLDDNSALTRIRHLINESSGVSLTRDHTCLRPSNCCKGAIIRVRAKQFSLSIPGNGHARCLKPLSIGEVFTWIKAAHVAKPFDD
jgi:hypothetical protein